MLLLRAGGRLRVVPYFNYRLFDGRHGYPTHWSPEPGMTIDTGTVDAMLLRMIARRIANAM
jgi:hypothetical protein